MSHPASKREHEYLRSQVGAHPAESELSVFIRRNAIVTDQRVGEREQLAAVGRVGEGLRVAHHAGLKHCTPEHGQPTNEVIVHLTCPVTSSNEGNRTDEGAENQSAGVQVQESLFSCLCKQVHMKDSHVDKLS